MSTIDCPPCEQAEPSTELICPDCGEKGRSVPRVTLLHLLEPRVARGVDPAQNYGVCRERDCPVLYFSSSGDSRWTTDEVRIHVGFKRAADTPPHPVCYCFGYTEENIAREIDETGESTVVEWITERFGPGNVPANTKIPRDAAVSGTCGKPPTDVYSRLHPGPGRKEGAEGLSGDGSADPQQDAQSETIFRCPSRLGRAYAVDGVDGQKARSTR